MEDRRRAIVTGATGHLGRFLVRELLNQGGEVLALVRAGSDIREFTAMSPRVEIVSFDGVDPAPVQKRVDKFQAPTIFHLAWQGVSGAERGSGRQMLINIPLTMKLFEMAKAAGCQTWIGVGSQAEYGTPSGILREDRRPAPETAYGVAKYCAGLLIQTLCKLSEMRFVWLRLSASYGPNDDPSRLIPTSILAFLGGRSPTVSTGEQRWDYLYVEDVATSLIAAASAKAEGIFNLGSGSAVRVREIVEMIGKKVDPKVVPTFGGIPSPHGIPGHLEMDISRYLSAVPWKPQTSLTEGLDRTIAWYRGQR